MLVPIARWHQNGFNIKWLQLSTRINTGSYGEMINIVATKGGRICYLYVLIMERLLMINLLTFYQLDLISRICYLYVLITERLLMINLLTFYQLDLISIVCVTTNNNQATRQQFLRQPFRMQGQSWLQSWLHLLPPDGQDQIVREEKTADSIIRITEIVQKVSDFKTPTDNQSNHCLNLN